MKELELDAALLQHFVEGSEDDVAHARAHLPEDVTSVGEEHAQRAAQALPRRDAWPLKVAVLVRQRERVETAHECGVEGALRGAVQAQPFGDLVVVDRIEAARIVRQAEADDAAHDGEREIDDLPQPADLVVLFGDDLQLAVRVGGQRIHQVQDRALRVE
jgi:hypothetical protein